jgi:Na+/H+-translocating membrane pyrophosphatase
VSEPNPYRAPGAPVTDPRPARRGSTFAAISAGLAADVLGTFVGSIVVTIVLGVWLAGQGVTADGMHAFMADSGAFQVFSLLFGLAFTMLGGYVAAHVANFRELWHGMVLGIASLAFGELYVAIADADIALWQRIASWLLIVPAGIYGAFLYRKRKRGRA